VDFCTARLPAAPPRPDILTAHSYTCSVTWAKWLDFVRWLAVIAHTAVSRGSY